MTFPFISHFGTGIAQVMSDYFYGQIYCEAKIIMNRLNFKQFFATLTLLALSMQMFSFTVFAQSLVNDTRAEKVLEINQDEPADFAPNSKIAPDLQESVDGLANGFRADETQKVIIQLKPSTELNEMFGNDLSEADKKSLFDEEKRGNRQKAAKVGNALASMNGRMKKSFENLGLVSAELPLSKVQEIAGKDEVEFISADAETSATGHIESATGTENVRYFYDMPSVTVQGNRNRHCRY